MVDRPNKPGAIPVSDKSKQAQAQVDISSDSSQITATLPTGDSVEILLHGATVTSWKSGNGQENLWLSEKAILDGSKPVRGGIPIVFPNFGPAPANHATSKLPQHGFARNATWEYLGKSTSESGSLSSTNSGDDRVKLDFGLYPAKLSAAARAAWPADFGLIYSVTLGANELQTTLNVKNEGTEAFEFQMLLHTYLRVKDISQTTITGLLGVQYTDKVLNATKHTSNTAHTSIAGEVDRVYHALPQDTTSVLEGGAQHKPRFDIVRDNLPDAVIWNPGPAKAAAMADFAPADGYKQMLCVEVGSVSDWQRLEGGEGFEAGQILRSLL